MERNIARGTSFGDNFPGSRTAPMTTSAAAMQDARAAASMRATPRRSRSAAQRSEPPFRSREYLHAAAQAGRYASGFATDVTRTDNDHPPGRDAIESGQQKRRCRRDRSSAWMQQ